MTYNRSEMKAQIDGGTITITRRGCDKCTRGIDEITFDTVANNVVSMQTLKGEAARLVWDALETRVLREELYRGIK